MGRLSAGQKILRALLKGAKQQIFFPKGKICFHNPNLLSIFIAMQNVFSNAQFCFKKKCKVANRAKFSFQFAKFIFKELIFGAQEKNFDKKKIVFQLINNKNKIN